MNGGLIKNPVLSARVISRLLIERRFEVHFRVWAELCFPQLAQLARSEGWVDIPPYIDPVQEIAKRCFPVLEVPQAEAVIDHVMTDVSLEEDDHD